VRAIQQMHEYVHSDVFMDKVAGHMLTLMDRNRVAPQAPTPPVSEPAPDANES